MNAGQEAEKYRRTGLAEKKDKGFGLVDICQQ